MDHGCPRRAGGTVAVDTADNRPGTLDTMAHPIYRQFGDMQGLVDAVADEGFARYVRGTVVWEGAADPVANLPCPS